MRIPKLGQLNSNIDLVLEARWRDTVGMGEARPTRIAELRVNSVPYTVRSASVLRVVLNGVCGVVSAGFKLEWSRDHRTGPGAPYTFIACWMLWSER